MVDIDSALRRFKKRIAAMSDEEVLAFMDRCGLEYSFAPARRGSRVVAKRAPRPAKSTHVSYAKSPRVMCKPSVSKRASK